MNNRRGRFLLLVAGMPFVGCASGGVPPDAVALVTPLSLEPPPIYALLGYRADLRLTSEQVTSLDSIARSIRDENRVLVQRLQETGREQGRSGVVAVMADGGPILDEIRENQRRAGDAVAAVLDEEQRATVCRLFDPRERGTNRAGGAAARRVREPRGADERLVRPAGWHWCVETGEEAETASRGAPPVLISRGPSRCAVFTLQAIPRGPTYDQPPASTSASSPFHVRSEKRRGAHSLVSGQTSSTSPSCGNIS